MHANLLLNEKLFLNVIFLSTYYVYDLEISIYTYVKFMFNINF